MMYLMLLLVLSVYGMPPGCGCYFSMKLDKAQRKQKVSTAVSSKLLWGEVDTSGIRDRQLVNVVSQLTRENYTLDLVISSLRPHYQNTTILPPVGRSEHSAALWKPIAQPRNPPKGRLSTCSPSLTLLSAHSNSGSRHTMGGWSSTRAHKRPRRTSFTMFLLSRSTSISVVKAPSACSQTSHG